MSSSGLPTWTRNGLPCPSYAAPWLPASVPDAVLDNVPSLWRAGEMSDRTLSPVLATGLTVPELARFLRVGEDTIRGWIRRGELAAINTASPLGKPRFVVLPHHLVAFEASRQVVPAAKKATRRRKRTTEIDYYPDYPD